MHRHCGAWRAAATVYYFSPADAFRIFTADESICIVAGTPTRCIMEGRPSSMSGYSTSSQRKPRGRVHYFVNEANEPMAMVWVC